MNAFNFKDTGIYWMDNICRYDSFKSDKIPSNDEIITNRNATKEENSNLIANLFALFHYLIP